MQDVGLPGIDKKVMGQQSGKCGQQVHAQKIQSTCGLAAAGSACACMHR
jgi:hypothetical protein